MVANIHLLLQSQGPNALMPFPGFHRHCAHVVHRHTRRQHPYTYDRVYIFSYNISYFSLPHFFPDISHLPIYTIHVISLLSHSKKKKPPKTKAKTNKQKINNKKKRRFILFWSTTLEHGTSPGVVLYSVTLPWNKFFSLC